MQRLRSTFKRSRTPTGAEMKSQSSLEVPKQVRSASFDEIQLEATKRQQEAAEGAAAATAASTDKDSRRSLSPRHDRSSASPTRTPIASFSTCSPSRSHHQEAPKRSSVVTLRVPQLRSGQRSKSFDVYEMKTMTMETSTQRQKRLSSMGRSTGSSGAALPRRNNRAERETPLIQLSGCYHCACVEEYRNFQLRKLENDRDEQREARNRKPELGAAKHYEEYSPRYELSDDAVEFQDEDDNDDDDNDDDDDDDENDENNENENDDDDDDDDDLDLELLAVNVPPRLPSGQEDNEGSGGHPGDDNSPSSSTNRTASINDDEDRCRGGSPEIRVTLTIGDRCGSREERSMSEFDTGSSDGSDIRQCEYLTSCQGRRRSVASPRLWRQEALTSFPTELPTVPIDDPLFRSGENHLDDETGNTEEAGSNEHDTLDDCEPENDDDGDDGNDDIDDDEEDEEEEDEENNGNNCDHDDADDDDDDDDDEKDDNENDDDEERRASSTGSSREPRSSSLAISEPSNDLKTRLVVRDIFLTVPELKRDRAASVDSCFNNNKNGKKKAGAVGAAAATTGIYGSASLEVPQTSVRSKSVDIVLPTEAQTRYTALLPQHDTRPLRGGREEGGGTSGGQREPRSTPDWGDEAINGEHLWVPTAASGDFCYVNDCSKHGPRVKCAACRVVAHLLCAGGLSFECKPSFRDVGVRQYREQTSTNHHWVHRRSEKGKCANCGKAFQSKLSFSSKEIVAVSCSWCKAAYHNKEACFNVQKIGENCELGSHGSIIVPPSWIIKLPRKGSFRSSLRKSPRRKKSGGGGGGGGGGSGASCRRKGKEKDKEKEEKEQENKMWIVKPIPTVNVRPVLVFINPKSGGNQGAKLLQKFQWHLNPRQVFDLTQGGPKMGLELFKKVPNLRVLACGGDGTVGWVLSVLDQIGANPPPAVGVLPLGTGNDLARALGWGGGYTDEPIAKILSNIGESETTLLDRWQLTVERNQSAGNDDDSAKGKENLPLNVVNNYFSLGVDAHIALEFHEAREAHPEKFNSRLRNKMFYGQMGGKDLVRRKWKDLSEFVSLECDGQDLTPKLKEHRVHAIVLLNIASYGGGTHPWGAASGTKEPSTEDGLLEVVGLTTYQLPLLQAGGHGTCIAQCSKAKLITTRTIPMQVDGEACRLLPSTIEMTLLNKATMLAKRRSTGKPQQNPGAKLESLKLPVMRIKMSDYESHHSDKDRLKKVAVPCLAEPLDIDATTDLEALRKILAKDQPMDTCCFLDSCTAERFFRIDRAQEQLHYVTDVAVEAIYVLEENPEGGRNNDPEPETAQASPSEERSDRTMTMIEEKPSPDPPPPRETTPPRVSKQASEKDPPRLEEKPLGAELPQVLPVVPVVPAMPEVLPVLSEVTLVPEITEGSSPKAEPTAKKPLDLLPSVESQKKNKDGKREATKLLSKQSSSKSFADTAAAGRSQNENSSTFISPRDRLFSLSSEVHTFSSGLLEKTSDGILRAAKIGELRALRELHERGYSLLSIDANGQTALHVAARHGHKDIVRYLIACAPPTILNMVDNDKGQTALHKAAQQKRRSICCMLVAGGATLTVRDRYGNTPRELALVAEDRDLAAYLHSQEQFQLATEDMENDGP